jgi:cytochrome c oxidase assembly factor CtaG
MDGIRMQRRSVPHGRTWLAVAALLLLLVCAVPPAGTIARRYVFAESLQFVLFAVAIPALFVLGAPWRALGFAGRSRPVRGTRPGRRRPGSGRGFATLVAFMAAVIAWRLPVSVDALATVPGLVVVEMVTLTGVGTALWLELVESPPLLPRVPRPLRAFFAALAMWMIWILAYILGFSHVAWFTAYSQPGMSPVADQEIATGIMWAVPALCFVPFVYATILTWLKDSEDPDEGLRSLVGAENPSRPGRWPRPPRGWDRHST